MKCVFVLTLVVEWTWAFGLFKQTCITNTNKQSAFTLVNLRSATIQLLSANDETDGFWESQKILAASMSESLDKEESKIKLSVRQAYNKKVTDLVLETFYFSTLIFCGIWALVPNPFTGVSYLLGAVLGTAYTYGLGKYVETLGGNAYDTEDIKGSGVGSARFAFLILLFIFVGKFRSQGLQEIPAIMGFFTYQLASLSQGLKDSAED